VIIFAPDAEQAARPRLGYGQRQRVSPHEYSLDQEKEMEISRETDIGRPTTFSIITPMQ
jgi:hypothetical protein